LESKEHVPGEIKTIWLDNINVFDGNSVQLSVELLALKSTRYNGYPEMSVGNGLLTGEYRKVELTVELIAKYPSYKN